MRAAIASTLAAAYLVADPALPIQSDINLPFARPTDRSWVRLSFTDGGEEFASMGGATNLARGITLVFVDVFVPLGKGDGEAVTLANVAKNALRRLSVTGARWQRFEGGAEGPLADEYRKQVIAVFLRTDRV